VVVGIDAILIPSSRDLQPIVSDYADKMRYKPEEQDRLDITYHSRKSAFKELIEIELMYRQRDRLAKRDM
jgi:hypothetical protein